jgi:hypothetical protein
VATDIKETQIPASSKLPIAEQVVSPVEPAKPSDLRLLRMPREDDDAAEALHDAVAEALRAGDEGNLSTAAAYSGLLKGHTVTRLNTADSVAVHTSASIHREVV